MKLQKQLSRKVGEKKYPKWVLVIPPEVIEKSGFKVGNEIKAKVKKGEIKLIRKVKNGR